MNYLNMTTAEFNKYINKNDTVTKDDFEKILEIFNDKYMKTSEEIMKLNEDRHNIIDKIRFAQTEYKKKFGTNDINFESDLENDNSDVETEHLNEVVDETKLKKAILQDVELQLDDNSEPELEQKPAKPKSTKSKAVKTTKATKMDVANIEPLAVEKDIVETIIAEKVKKTKRTKKEDVIANEQIQETTELKQEPETMTTQEPVLVEKPVKSKSVKKKIV